MFRPLRLLPSLALLLLPSGCQAPSPRAAAAPPGVVDARQIEWQRSLDDAQTLAAAEHRPLLIAVNMDGESASDRIVHENYRDPAFVAATRRCVCVVASVFRHNACDYDAFGRRIPCPRLGCVTCGEHMAIEPQLFARLLADGERVAPRHAVVLPDGRKVFDLSLCFDLHDIDRALFAAVQDVPERVPVALAGAAWETLAAQRDHAGRCALEAALASADDAATRAAVDAIAKSGDAGSLAALRLVGRHPDRAFADHFFSQEMSPELRSRLVAAARARGLAGSLAAVWREQLEQLPGPPSDVGSWFGDGENLLPALAELDGTGAATRSLLLAQCVLAYDADLALRCLRTVTPEAMDSIAAALRASGGPFDLFHELDLSPAVIRTAPSGDEMPETDALESTLTGLDATAQTDRDADWNARYAKASLDLGRRRLEARQKDAELLLDDADLHWQKALELEPRHAGWWIERARTAYFLGQFANEAAHGQRAFEVAAAAGKPDSPLQDAVAVEALRWVGDGNARLLAERTSAGAAIELRGIAEGMRALARVAASVYGTAQDWLSLASFCGALGLRGAEFHVAERSAMWFPADRDLRQYLNQALLTAGQFWRVTDVADAIARQHPDSADAQWFAGYAWMLAAENHRRVEAPDDALADYEQARLRFERAKTLRADYADDCRRMIALTFLGRGFAHAQTGRRAPAADGLVAAVKSNADLAAARDGLGYDVFDLVDKILEWRETGPSNVEPLALLDRLLQAAPGQPFYGLAIADSLLREALRADGRNPVRAERGTVDAGGNRIRMPMGLPTDDGDRYLRASIAVARRVLQFTRSDADKMVLAQSDTICAERMLERNRLDGVAEALAEAAPLLGQQAPPAGADVVALAAAAARLRELLGEARPRLREGR
ncbi:MAG TPA: hypothetical protein VK348_15730 [Planctomycetota bacterium]|nr:hypothetical protein [Planctomycetota bacterium]